MSRLRIRSVKPELWADERVGSLSRDARLLFVGLMTMADDEGRLRALPAVILGHVFPYDADATRKLSGWLDEIVRSGSLLAYEHDGKPYLAFRHWRRHQRINRAVPSTLPDPPDPEVVADNAVPDDARRAHEARRAQSRRSHESVSDMSVTAHDDVTSSSGSAHDSPAVPIRSLPDPVVEGPQRPVARTRAREAHPEFNGTPVTDDELAIAADLLAGCEKLLGFSRTVLTGQGTLSPAARLIVGRHRDTGDDLEAMRAAVRGVKRIRDAGKPWWQGDTVSEGIVFGPAVYERNRDEGRKGDGRRFGFDDDAVYQRGGEFAR